MEKQVIRMRQYIYIGSMILLTKKSQNSSLKRKYTIADKVSLRFNSQDPDMIYVVNKEYIIQFMSLIFAIFSVVFYLLVSLLLSFHNHI